MNIEWQQLLTHLVGFLITVWILKKFAWGPLLGIMEERRSKIAGEFDKIEQEKAAAAELSASYEAKLKEIDNERRAKLIAAVEEGKRHAAEIKSAAQNEIKGLHEKARLDIERDIDKARVQLRDEMVGMTISAAEKIIHEKLDEPKHRELIGKFIDDLEKA